MTDAPIAVDSESAARRPLDRLGPFGVFAVLWVALALLYALTTLGLAGRSALVGREPGAWIEPVFRFNLVYLAVIAFIATSLRHEHAAIRRDFDALRTRVEASDAEWQQWRVTLFAPGPTRVLAWLAIGALIGQGVHFLGGRFGDPPTGVWPGHFFWMGLLATVLFALIAVLAALSVRRARIFLAMGRRARVNLLDPGELAPFARVGLRAAAYWFLGTSLATLLMIDADAWGIVAVVNTGTLALGVVSLLLPSRGVNASLRAAKARELARVRAVIDQLRTRLLDAPGDPAESARMNALLAWEARIDAVSVWPFDTPTLMRFALFLLVPLGSWLGGALVERAVDTFIP